MSALLLLVLVLPSLTLCDVSMYDVGEAREARSVPSGWRLTPGAVIKTLQLEPGAAAAKSIYKSE